MKSKSMLARLCADVDVAAVLMPADDEGATGVCATNVSKEWIWLKDKYFYPLDSLFEFVVLAIMLWPALLARIACALSKDPSPAKTSGDGKA